MADDQLPPSSRRAFLAATTTLAVAGTLARAGEQPTGAPSAVTPPPPPPPPPPTPRPQSGPEAPPAASADGINAETIKEAEKLAGIEFTPAKQEMMAKTLPDQVARLGHRQVHPLPPNGLAPALTFDPRLPGVKFDREQRSIVRSEGGSPLPAVPTSDEDIAFAPITMLSRWIEGRKLTSRRLTDIYIERLKRLNSKLQFVITLTDDLARKQADRADAEIAAGQYRGPLHGIPWGAKDLLDTAGILTTWGAEPYADRVPDLDAAVVRKLEEAGAVLVAKTTLGALAYGDIWHGGRTNNPWNPEKGSSGSSAGSASAAAAGCIGFGIGTETLGSIVSPSRTCGVTGLRPTFGRVSRAGAMALCWSLDKVGPIARSAEDCALVLAAINGPDAADSCSVDMPFNFDAGRSVRGLRVGHIAADLERKGLAQTHNRALEILREAGCELVEFKVPEWPYDTLLTILRCEAAAAFEELTRTGKDDMLKWQAPQAWPNTFRETWFTPGVELVQAYRFRRECMMMMAEKFANVDAVIDPTNTGGPLLLITNNTGHPSITVPIGFGEDGLPRATTLIGRLYDEGTIVRLGMLLEAEFKVWEKRPSL